MSQQLDELYFTWLYGHVGSVKDRVRSRTYWSLLRQLYKTEFVWSVAKDENRAEDGKELRLAFAVELHLTNIDEEWFEMGCSVLELLIGLSKRLEYMSQTPEKDWFWILMTNLELYGYTDSEEIPEGDISAKVDRFMYREYDSCGSGGLFPLRDPPTDQRKQELWYQLNYYLLENE